MLIDTITNRIVLYSIIAYKTEGNDNIPVGQSVHSINGNMPEMYIDGK